MKRTHHFLLLSLSCFLFSLSINAQTFSDSLEQRILNAQADGRIINNLNNAFATSPKGEFLLAPSNKDLKFGILIYNIDIFPDRAEFSAGLAFRDSRSNRLVAFRADHVVFSHTYGLTGPVKLYLVSDVSLTLGQSATIYFLGGSQNTNAVFDCKGLREFGINGRVDFNSDFLLPVATDGSAMPEQNLSANFQFMAKSWSDMVVQISIQPFQIKGLTDFVFDIDHATMDLSESFNAGEMRFPDVYNSNEILGNSPSIWEGFYLQKGSVMFPAHFQSADKQRPELGVQDLLIDEFGFSGSIYGKHLISFEKGRLANWNFSIEQVQIDIVLNEIKGGRMVGDIGMPVLPDTTRLAYSAYISANDNYGLLVSMRSGVTIPAFKVAKANIARNSYIDMEIEEGKVLLAAELNGEFLIENKSSGAGPQFNFPVVVFQDFRVANTEPEIDIKYLGLKSTANATKVNAYPVNINSIYFSKSGNESYVGVEMGLNLMEQVSVKTGLRIYARQTSGRFCFQKMELSEIALKAVTSCFRMEGKLNFIKEDAVFGNGLNGIIRFNMDQPKIGADASVLFGNINGHRYWYFDASAIWENPGIPFFAGAEINGLMGGAWQGMREVNEKDKVSGLKYGMMSNGRTYLPDSRSGLGLKAGVYMKSTGGNRNSRPFAATAVLEMQFNANKGLNKIALLGTMDLMTDNSQLEKAALKQAVANVPGLSAWDNFKRNYLPKGKIGGPLMMDFDFINKIYQANFAVYLQGVTNNRIAGSGYNGLAGEASAYFSSKKWYVWLGTPQQPLSVKLNLGQAGNAGITAYFMAGDEVKPAMPLPGEITAVLGEQQADAMRDLNAMAEGNAFAFGARFNMMAGSSGGEGNVRIYANLKAIAGFDINLASYGKNTSCAGHSGPPGLNGWFANGQLFAFLQGRVGASYKAGALSGQVDLMTLTFASRLYCQGPNPFYSSGSAAVQVNIAGVINKKMNLHFEVGEPCEMKRLAYSDSALILETHPSGGEMQISTFLPLQTRFSVPVEKPFTDVDGRKVMFRVSRYEVTDAEKIINGRLEWNAEKNNLSFVSLKALPGNKKIRVQMVVEAVVLNRTYELRNSDGSKAIMFPKDREKFNALVGRMKLENLKRTDFGGGKIVLCIEAYESLLLNGKKVEEQRDFQFTTATAPARIPENNIVSAWPVPGQLNYYKNMSSGYIQLQLPQDELLNAEGTKVMALFTNSKGVVTGESKVDVKGTNLNFVIPDQMLSADGVYGLTIKRRDANAVSELGKILSVANEYIRPENVLAGAAVAVPKQVTLPDKILLTYSFGVSKYNGFSEKMNAISLGLEKQVRENSLQWKVVKEGTEYFDKPELIGLSNKKPLIGVKLQRDPNNIFTKECSKVYSIMKCSDMKLRNTFALSRDTSEAGLYPYGAVKIRQDYAEQMVLKQISPLQGNFKPAYTNVGLSVECEAYTILCNDLEDIRKGLIQYVTSGEDFNMQLVRNYCNLFQSKEPGRNANYESGLTNLDLKGLSVNALLQGSSLPQQNNQQTQIASGLSTQSAALLMQISKLKLNPLKISDEWSLSFVFTLPGASRPSANFLIKK